MCSSDLTDKTKAANPNIVAASMPAQKRTWACNTAKPPITMAKTNRTITGLEGPWTSRHRLTDANNASEATASNPIWAARCTSCAVVGSQKTLSNGASQTNRMSR